MVFPRSRIMYLVGLDFVVIINVIAVAFTSLLSEIGKNGSEV